MLCPKGVKRYMQDEHPDRLLTPLARDEAHGFQPIDWDAALDRTAREIQRIQAAYRRAFARKVTVCVGGFTAHQVWAATSETLRGRVFLQRRGRG
jgi:anaerobic selenocysteine-containing dehydrogenase